MIKNKQPNILITDCASGCGLHAAQILQTRGYGVFAPVRQANDVAKLTESGLVAMPFHGAYNALKFALDRLTCLFIRDYHTYITYQPA